MQLQTTPNAGLPLATDPPVSEKQRKAMWAAAGGKSTLGIPKKVGEEFVGKDAEPKRAAGVLFTAGDLGLFLKRGADADHPGEWCLPGGGAEDDEDPEATARREAEEETKFKPNGIRPIHQATTDDGVDFVTFHQAGDDQFRPSINDEHAGYAWAPLSDPPQPLHPGVDAMLRGCRGATDEMDPWDWDGVMKRFAETLGAQDDQHAASISLKTNKVLEKLTPTTGVGDPTKGFDSALAFDRASVRNVDADGRLHVAVTNISKANICPYVGSEIPDYDKLGLDSRKLYQLLRDPEEIEKAAATFNNLPVLSKHVPVSAVDHHPELVIGSTGTDAEFKEPYLRNSMVFWVKDAIDAIESDEQKELSSAYRYRADMTPGTYMGAHYDGVMRDIVGNHVALVKEGRAGTDVVVGDSRETITRMENDIMSGKLSHKARLVQGALSVFLRPKLAQDAKLDDLATVLKDVTAKNYVDQKPAIIAALGKIKLAKDAKLDELPAVLDSLDKLATDEFPLPEKKEGEDADPDDEDKKPGMDAEGIKNFLKDKISEDDMKALDAIMEGTAPALQPDKPAVDADPDDDKIDKKAMDEAIKGAVKAAHDAATQTQKDIREAEKKVRPYVGELAIAHDSAEGVYRTALGMLGVKGIEKVHASALPYLLDAQPVPGSKKETATPLALDSSAIDSFNKRFPNAARIGSLG